jgi:predicted enzyme related to lactoylglutathione lyase
MDIKIGSVVIDCNNFDKMAAFWQEALHYTPQQPAKPDDWVLLGDPSGKSPNLGVNKKSKSVSGKIRLHLDLYTSNQTTEVERLLKIGATVVRGPEKGHDYVILADPEGNHFCVVDTEYKP